ncbi:MAG: hypothetical protein A3E82_04580 [Gammaproteobacteria bacterium RIFCSPHIGHO2_12_FULL_38_11]|nr:MAG: hypothetical protein A3E82_04580 [Gammaproteobacteria bacterium RIFCSPHIGHO2_12_FULL_38_11]
MIKKQMKLVKKYFLLPGAFFLISQIALAADCAETTTLPPMPLYFYNHLLNNGDPYTINLLPTLSAMSTAEDDTPPYYKKPWTGNCPMGMDADAQDCIEFTVYPNAINFSPGNIMQQIEQYTSNGKPNRGEVRIITDASETHYVYTTDHESSYCGPYSVQFPD